MIPLPLLLITKEDVCLVEIETFFRYFVGEFTGTPPYKIYYGFSVKTLEKGGTYLKLTCRDGYFNVAKGGPKSICNELPKTNNYASSLELEENGSWNYVAGCGSNIPHLPNPYYRVRPLRQCLYEKLGILSVKENILLWDEVKKAHWSREDVLSDNQNSNLLDYPKQAFQAIFGKPCENTKNYPKIQWRNHIFSQKFVVAETISQYRKIIKSKKSRSVLAILKEIDT